MLIFIADGRLGNNLFQYAFLKTIAGKREKIIVYGFDDLFKVFDGVDVINIRKNKFLNILMYKFLRYFLYFLADKKIISSIQIEYEYVKGYRRETEKYRFMVGLMRNVKLVKTAFFQSEKMFDKNVLKSLVIKKEYVEEARKFLSQIPDDAEKVCVHIRRGDYKNFKVYGEDCLLPVTYYRFLIDWFRKNFKKTFFIFLSDEPDFVEKNFSDLENKLISKNSMEVDFAIFTECTSAILSASSFSWWGCYFMRKKNVIFAPRYWLGWKSKVYYQSPPPDTILVEINGTNYDILKISLERVDLL